MKKIFVPLLLMLALGQAHADLRVPANTAYLDPNPDGAAITGDGITDWNNPHTKVFWFGEIKTPGKLYCSLPVRLPAGTTSELRLTVAGQSHTATIKGQGDSPVNTSFGTFDISAPGYQEFTLESLNPDGQPAGDFDALILDGPATQSAQFNLKSRRNAASVHLMYPLENVGNVDTFYCEVTGEKDPVGTYYMACGWQRGYFGMQVNSPTERRIIFSVWDSGSEPVSRDKVQTDNRVTLVAKGDDVYAGDFGNEGTGGHSHLVYPWKTGEKQRFYVTAKPVDETYTIYSGYFYRSDLKKWTLIASWKAPKDGNYLRGLYSFNEDFDGENGWLRRKALFGNQWIHTADGRWVELTTAKFSHDATGRSDRFDRFMGIEGGQFFLSNGGFIPGSTHFGEKFTRPAIGQPPADIVLSALPTVKS